MHGTPAQQLWWRLALVAIGSGVALGLAVVQPYLWPLVFLGVWGVLVTLSRINTLRGAFFWGWLIGTTKSLIAISWFWKVYPIDWLGLEPGLLHIVLVFVYWVPCSLALGVGGGIFAVGWQYVKERALKVQIGAGVLLWVVGEALGATSFSVFTAGPGSYVTVGFSFGHSGYALAQHQLLLGLAAWGSVYVLSAVVFAITLVAFWYRQSHHRGFIVALGFIVLVSSLWAASWMSGRSIILPSVALVETNFNALSLIDPLLAREREQALFAAVRSALEARAEYVVLPEDARFSMYFENEEQIFHFMENISDQPTILIDSLRIVDESGKEVQRARVYDGTTRTLYEFDKQYLVPQGEFMPYIYDFLLRLVGPAGVYERTLQFAQIRPGVSQSDLMLPPRIPPVLFCFESITPHGIAAIDHESNTGFVAHVVSHAWFARDPVTLWNQQDAMLRIQAIYNNTTIMMAGNQAPAKVFFPSGGVVTPGEVAADEAGLWKVRLLGSSANE